MEFEIEKNNLTFMVRLLNHGKNHYHDYFGQY